MPSSSNSREFEPRSAKDASAGQPTPSRSCFPTWGLGVPSSTAVSAVFCSTATFTEVGQAADNKTSQLLAHWNGQTETEATWEDEINFKAAYPNFNLKDKVSFEEVGDDTMVARPSTIDPISKLYEPSDRTHDNQKPKDTRPQRAKRALEWMRDYC
ncbi:hypothetical protein SESBI_14159 [Sesbania bispinosa]|nr:hypothetical protein SESBI_14159 [Sesbania bispinosa]